MIITAAATITAAIMPTIAPVDNPPSGSVAAGSAVAGSAVDAGASLSAGASVGAGVGVYVTSGTSSRLAV